MNLLHNPTREKELLQRASYDLSAFEELYEFYFPGIYTYIRYRVNTDQDAEDLVSNTFLKAAEQISKFNWRGNGSFSAWLFKIAHYQVLNTYRKNGKEKGAVSIDELADVQSDAMLPDEVVLHNDRFERVKLLISTLSPRRQEIITLKFFGGLRNKDIAKILELDERTIASNLCRGLEDLLDKLGHEKRLFEKEKMNEQEK